MDETCPICDRALGVRREKHHVIPKSKGGKVTVLVHPICHSKIHKVFTRAELARLQTIDATRDHPEMERFVKWLSRKPPDFHAITR